MENVRVSNRKFYLFLVFSGAAMVAVAVLAPRAFKVLALSFGLAYLLDPAVDWLERRKVPRSLSIPEAARPTTLRRPRAMLPVPLWRRAPWASRLLARSPLLSAKSNRAIIATEETDVLDSVREWVASNTRRHAEYCTEQQHQFDIT